MTKTLAGGFQYHVTFLNCGADAFRTAVATLADRARRWGAGSASLADWLRAQDIVFADCSAGSGIPALAPPGSPALLVSDRAYQVAAAKFYTLQLDQATEQFRAIGRDNSSPWQPLGGYLAARSLVRKAFFARKDVTERASYDPATMRAAELQLRDYLKAKPLGDFRRAAEAELALVRIRVEPDIRARELGLLVAGPHSDPNYAQDVKGLLWYMDVRMSGGLQADEDHTAEERARQEQQGVQGGASTPGQACGAARLDVQKLRREGEKNIAALRASSPATDWLLTLRGVGPDSASHALNQWQRTRAVPWLVAALSLASETAASPALLAAAAALPVDSPGWETANYHRIRLLLIERHAEEARGALAQALPRVEADREPSSVNAFRGLQLLAAPTLAEFLAYAPRTVLLDTSQETNALGECRDAMRNPKRHYNCVQEPGPEQFDEDTVSVFNTQAPISIWREAAQSSEIGAQLRQALATGGWTRAVLPGTSRRLPVLCRCCQRNCASRQAWDRALRNCWHSPATLD